MQGGAATDRATRAQVARLYERYSEGLLTFFRAATPIAREDATDLLQQTFVEVLKWLSGEPDRTIQYPRAFLYRIANRVLGKYRDKQRRVPDRPQATEADVDARAHADDLEYLSGQHEVQRRAIRAMRRLGDPDVQVMLYLRYWEGLPERAVGEVLGASRSSIAGKLRRARENLLETIAALDASDPAAVRTTTTVLERWWREIEARAPSPDEPDDAEADVADLGAAAAGTTDRNGSAPDEPGTDEVPS